MGTQKIGPNGDGKYAVATLDRRSRKKKKTNEEFLLLPRLHDRRNSGALLLLRFHEPRHVQRVEHG